MDSLLYQSQILPCYSMLRFQISTHCEIALYAVKMYYSIPWISTLNGYYFYYLEIIYPLMSKVIIIIIKDLLLHSNALLVSLKPIEPFQIFNNAINWLFNIILNNLDITEFF